MCKRCDDTGKIGSPGYWIYCNCEEGRRETSKDDYASTALGEQK